MFIISISSEQVGGDHHAHRHPDPHQTAHNAFLALGLGPVLPLPVLGAFLLHLQSLILPVVLDEGVVLIEDRRPLRHALNREQDQSARRGGLDELLRDSDDFFDLEVRAL